MNSTKEISKEDCRRELIKFFSEMEDEQLIRYFYIFVAEKMKRAL